MTTLLAHRPSLLLSPFTGQTLNPLRRTTTRFAFSAPKPPSLVVAAGLGFGPDPFSDPELAAVALKDLLGRAEGFFYTIADAAVSSASAPPETAKQTSDWFTGIANYMEGILKVLESGLNTLHVPYAYGFAIILLTVLVKAATFPLTKKQVESAMAMRSLQPQIKAIQKRFAGDQERIQLETARLYKVAGINPFAGCLPTLATIPVWIGLYRALSNVASEGLLTEGFFWIPTLSGPTSIAARQSGSGISWLFPFVDGHPPLGWSDTAAYLVLPVLLIASQYISIQIMQTVQSNDPNMKTSQLLTKFLPLMIGYFALSVPSGLSLYWLTNNILSTGQQVWLQKLGGAKISVNQFTTDSIKDDKTQVQNSVTEITLPQNNRQQEEQLAPEGPRPGDRFKKLKEEEARRRRQIQEEEERKAEEISAKTTQMENGGDRNNEESSVEVVVETNDVNSSSSVNGNLSRSDLNENGNNNTATHQQTTNNEVLSTSLIVEKEEVEVYSSASISRDEKPSEEN